MPPDSPAPSGSKEKRGPAAGKPRRWCRRACWALAVLGILAILINGPIFRSIVRWQLGKACHDLYLEGEFRIGGTLLGGLQLDGLELVGSRNLQSLTLARAEVDYRLVPLIRGNWGEGITRIRASHIRARIDSSKGFPTKPDIEARSEKKRRQRDLTKIWQNLDALIQQDIRVDDLEFSISSPEGPILSVSDLSFRLRGGSGSITADEITLPDGQTGENLSADLTSTGSPLIQITSLAIADQLAINRLAIARPGPGSEIPQLSGEIQLFGGRVAAAQDSPTRWSVALASGAIDIEALANFLGRDVGMTGSIDHLAAAIDSTSDHLINADVGARDLGYQSYTADTTTATIAYREDQLLIESLVLNSGKNTLKLNGELAPGTSNFRATATLDAPDLGHILQASNMPDISGSLSANASIQLEDGKLTHSSAEIDAAELSYKDASLRTANLKIQTSAPHTLEFTLSTDIDGQAANTLTGSGSIAIETSDYVATAELDLPELSTLQPLLDALEIDQHPTGKLDLTWNGSGSLRNHSHQGDVSVPHFDLQLGGGTPVDGKLELDYAPDSYHLTQLSARSDALSVTGAAHLVDRHLKVESLRLFDGDVSIARADISIPFDPEKLSDLDAFLAQPGDVAIRVDSNKLRLSDLVAMAGSQAPIDATLDAKVEVSGTLSDPDGSGVLEVLQLSSPNAKDIAPAEAHLNFSLGGGQLTLDGSLEHPEIQPITITGHTPLQFGKLDRLAAQDIDIQLHLPDTDLERAKKFIPDLTHAEGNFSADIKITGSPGSPNLSGDLRARSRLLKFKDQAIPTVSDLAIEVHLDGSELQIETLSGYLAGGKINVEGNADFTNFANPLIGLSLVADQALLFRDDNLSLRANAALELQGRYQSATLEGKIGITQSRYFRAIEILPIGLPKSSPTPAAPAAPSFGTKREIGITAKPFADWTVKVDIVTDDAFLIRSNLASGDVTADLHVSGSGANPIPAGTVTLEKGIATLPFSELVATVGTLTFSQETGFDPGINFSAHSKVRDYEIKIFAYGSLSDPQTLITSDPPLPESDAVALIATGSKSSELGNSQVIAGDAALLLIDKLRRKYAKGTPLERRPGDVRDLLSFKAGQIDPRTGKRAASASLEVTDKVFLLGNVDVEGEYRGLVKFLFRFK